MCFIKYCHSRNRKQQYIANAVLPSTGVTVRKEYNFSEIIGATTLQERLQRLDVVTDFEKCFTKCSDMRTIP